MTADSEKTESQLSTDVPAEATTPAATPLISRRMVLRGATAAVPTILTLQSGAALAASSNFLGTVDHASQAIGEGGNVQCLDMASAEGGTPTRLDLGPNPDLHVQYIPQRSYYKTATGAAESKSDELVSIEYMCDKGGTYWYMGTTGDPQVALSAGKPVQAGFLVSSTALSSFSSAVNLKTYF